MPDRTTTRELPFTGSSTALRWSVRLWVLAILAGVFETLLVVADSWHDQDRGGLWAGVAVRTLVFAVGLVLAHRLSRGSRVGRIALTVLLSVLGLASLVVPAIADLVDGASLVEAFSDGGDRPPIFAFSRMVHVVAVVVATVLMWAPGALGERRARA